MYPPDPTGSTVACKEIDETHLVPLASLAFTPTMRSVSLHQSAPALVGDTSAPSRLPAPTAATSGQVGLANMLGALYVVALSVLAVLAVLFTDYGAVVVVAVVLVFFADLAWFVSTGAGLPWRIVGIRLVAREDHAPLGAGRLVPLPATWTVRTRGFRDSIEPHLAPVTFVRGADVASKRPLPAVAPGDAGYAPVGFGGGTSADAGVTSADTGAPVLRPFPPGTQRSQRHESPHSHGGRVRVTIDAQSRMLFTGTTIVGRGPVAEAEGDALITVTDLSRTLSKSHLRLELEADGSLYATDLGSTNGSTVMGGSGHSEVLVPHTPALLEPGDRVMLGDHEVSFATGGDA